MVLKCDDQGFLIVPKERLRVWGQDNQQIHRRLPHHQSAQAKFENLIPIGHRVQKHHDPEYGHPNNYT